MLIWSSELASAVPHVLRMSLKNGNSCSIVLKYLLVKSSLLKHKLVKNFWNNEDAYTQNLNNGRMLKAPPAIPRVYTFWVL